MMAYMTAQRRRALRRAVVALKQAGRLAQARGLLRKLKAREARALSDRIRYLNRKGCSCRN